MLASMTLQELRKLSVAKVSWCDCFTTGFTLSDGRFCMAGTNPFTESYTFNPAKKITKIIVTLWKHENAILQISFYHHQQRLVAVGRNDDWVVKFGYRREEFLIAEDE